MPDGPAATVLLARHGETPWNRESRVQGWAAAGLTDQGRRQADRLGEWLADREIDRLVASDLERTRETTARARSVAGDLPDPSFDRTLRERGFGVYQGFLATELVDRFPDYDGSESLLALPIDPLNGESVGTFLDRVATGWDQLAEETTPDETTLVVTHGGVLKLVRAMVIDGDPETALTRSSPPNCSITEIRLGDGEADLVGYGQRPWRED